MTAVAIVADGARSWVLDLPDSPILTPNDRAHWSRRSECALVWRTAARLLAREARIPHLERVAVRLEHWPKDRRRKDPDRNSLVAKWCLDGIVDAGVIDDDDAIHVTEVALRMHPPRDDRKPLWLLTIEEVPHVHD